MGQAWLKEAKGYYDCAEERRIERERERWDRRMMWECPNMLKQIVYFFFFFNQITPHTATQATAGARDKAHVHAN